VIDFAFIPFYQNNDGFIFISMTRSIYDILKLKFLLYFQIFFVSLW